MSIQIYLPIGGNPMIKPLTEGGTVSYTGCTKCKSKQICIHYLSNEKVMDLAFTALSKLRWEIVTPSSGDTFGSGLVSRMEEVVQGAHEKYAEMIHINTSVGCKFFEADQ